MTPLSIDISEGQKQMILLALAELSLRRPGWESTLRETAGLYGGERMFDFFRGTSSNIIQSSENRECLEDFQEKMEREVIPAIVEDVAMREKLAAVSRRRALSSRAIDLERS